jgi:intracellular sulfur oxidation DsrE/DsrF family protein
MKKRTFMAITFFLLTGILAAKMHYADPKPTFENPRKIFMRLNDGDVHAANHLIGTINNLLKEYPDDALKVAVVAYGPGMRVLRKDYDPATLKRLRSLLAYDIEIIGCLNTMETMGWKRKEFIDGVDYVQAGVAEAIERQAGGWIDATPY